MIIKDAYQGKRIKIQFVHNAWFLLVLVKSVLLMFQLLCSPRHALRAREAPAAAVRLVKTAAISA